MTRSTTGPEIILFIFPFFEIKLLAYSLEKCLHLVVRSRTTTKTSHTDLDTYIWHIWPQHVGSQSNPCFSQLLQTNIPKTQDNRLQIQFIYHPFGIFPPINHFILQKLKPTSNIWDWMPALQQISQIIQGIPYSYRHLLN